MSGSTSSSLWRNAVDFVSTQVAAVQGSLSRIINTAQGSMTRALAQSETSVALFLQNLVITALLQTRAATCVGPALDSLYAQFNFFRLGATYSSGLVTVARASPTVAASVPVGAVVTTGPGAVQFQVVKNTTNANWDPTVTSGGAVVGGYTMSSSAASMSIPVQCLTAGIVGNVQATAIYAFLQPIPYIDTVSNPNAFTNGLPAETDPAFRARFVLYINSRSLGVEGAIETAILGVQQGLTYKILDNTAPGGVVGDAPGTYTVYIDDGSGAAPSTLVSTIYAAIDAVNGFTIEFYVLAATPLDANISLELTIASGYAFSAVQAAVATALQAFGASLGVGQPLPFTRISQIAYDASPGVINVTDIQLNSGTADLVPANSQVVQVPGPTIDEA